jgi:TIR domain
VASETQPRALQVFISYSHDSLEHKARVLSVAEHLLTDGIEVILDQYIESDSPEEGWPRWMDQRIDEADFVLLVCTETYLRRVKGHEQLGQGHGVLWEAHLIYQHIYNTATRNPKFIPVLLEGGKFDSGEK